MCEGVSGGVLFPPSIAPFCFNFLALDFMGILGGFVSFCGIFVFFSLFKPVFRCSSQLAARPLGPN